MLLSRRMYGWNDQEEQWNRMRSAVRCDVINLLAFGTHNGQPQRDALSWQGSRFWHGPSRSIFPFIYLSPICLPLSLCSPSKLWNGSHTNANQNTFHQSSAFLPTFLSSLCGLHFAALHLSYSCLLPSGYILFGRPVQGNSIRCPFVDCLEAGASAFALTWAVNKVLSKCSSPIFLGRLQVKSQLVETS